MPVSVSLTYGTVYYFPPEAAACMVNFVAGCVTYRQAVPGATVTGGYAQFEVGGSVSRPVGGYYQVSAGSNVAIIVGTTAACLFVTLTVLAGSVYFRKHPDKWDAFKLWGPKKYTEMRRSLLTRV